MLQITERAIGDVTVLDLQGRLVAGDGDQEFLDAISRLVDRGRLKVLLNFDGVNYIDSGGLGAIVSKYVTLHRRDGQLKLCNLHPRTRRVLDITRLLTVLEAFDSEADALKSFSVAAGGA